MSGDMNTALGNCLLMCAMTHYIFGTVGVKARLANNGDDCFVWMNDFDFPLMSNLESEFLEFGFNMKLEKPVRDFEEMVFCQTQPVLIGQQWRMIRQIIPALEKDLTLQIQNLTKKLYDEWRNAVSLGGMALCSGVPIFQSFYKWMGRGAGSTRANPHLGGLISSGFYRFSKGMNAREAEVTMQTRISFWKAFGIIPERQIWIETILDGLEHTFNPTAPVESLSIQQARDFVLLSTSIRTSKHKW